MNNKNIECDDGQDPQTYHISSLDESTLETSSVKIKSCYTPDQLQDKAFESFEKNKTSNHPAKDVMNDLEHDKNIAFLM